MSSRNCVHFSADIFDPTTYNEAQAQGVPALPVRVGYPPRFDYNAEFVFNYQSTPRSGAYLRQENGFAITARSDFTVPASCLEVIFSRKTRMMMFINPLCQSKWLHGPVFLFWSSTGASSSSSTVNLQPRVTSATPWTEALQHLWRNKAC